MRAVLVFLILFDAAVALGSTADAFVGGDAARAVPYSIRTMGTVGSVTIVTGPSREDSLASATAARAALEAFVAVDRRFSNWTTTSEIAGVNRALGHAPVALSEEAGAVVRTALDVAHASGGAFDPTVEPLVRLWGFLGGTPHVPDADAIASVRATIGHDLLVLEDGALRATAPDVRIDLGGIAKGHAVDRAVAVLREHGIENALVDLSGNMIALGRPPGRAHWTLGVRDPATPDGWFASLRLAGEAIATSGDYEQFVTVDGERYGHVLDPRTGWPTDDLVSATVLAPTAIEADAWATAVLVLGSDAGRALLTARDDLSGVLVQRARDGQHRVWVESSLRERFGVVEEKRERFEVEWFGGGVAR